MGAGLSAQRNEFVKIMPKYTDFEEFYSSQLVTDPEAAGFDVQDFIDGIEQAGVTIKKEDLPEIFKKLKPEQEKKKKNVEVIATKEEFMKFCIVENRIQQAESRYFEQILGEKSVLWVDKYQNIHGLMGPIEAAHGYITALAVLQHKPALAMVPLTVTTPGNPEGYVGKPEQFPYPETKNEWLPLHMLICGGQNSTVIRQEGLPLIKALLEAYPQAASARVQPQMSLQDGHLPLYLALQFGWDVDVIKVLLSYYPEAKTSMDVLQKTKKGKKPTLKNSCWARKIAEDHECSEEILVLLPKPVKAKKKELKNPKEGDVIINGFKWVDVLPEDA